MDIPELHLVHIITDNARQGSGTLLDMNAGEQLLRYPPAPLVSFLTPFSIRFVRGRRSIIPVLVYCGDLKYTAYTKDFSNCKATTARAECKAFIDELRR